MTTWQEYQEEAAAFFRKLGMSANVDEHIVGVRGAHDVDVAVRKTIAGIEQLWIIECKQRQRRVEKLHVAALANIVDDIGADRGILLSESGFQAGAIRMSRSRNITLSSIADLAENAGEERIQIGLLQLRKRLSVARNQLSTLTITRRSKTSSMLTDTRAVPGADMSKIIRLHALSGYVESGLSVIDLENWPTKYIKFIINSDEPALGTAANAEELLSDVETMLGDLESEIEHQKNAIKHASNPGGPSATR